MIEAVKGLRGQEQALCKCDECATEISVAASHGDNGQFHSTKSRNGAVCEAVGPKAARA